MLDHDVQRDVHLQNILSNANERAANAQLPNIVITFNPSCFDADHMTISFVVGELHAGVYLKRCIHVSHIVMLQASPLLRSLPGSLCAAADLKMLQALRG